MATNTRKSDEKYCSACGTIIHETAASCPKCGAEQQRKNNALITRQINPTIPSNASFCRHCGQSIHVSAISCPNCGGINSSINTDEIAGYTKDRIAAAMLAFFLGGIGVHKFYCGHIGLGIVYLIFFWTFIPAIVGFIEGIIYLTCPDNITFTRRYCSNN